MRLADFISRDIESILAQWEAFAATLLPAAANLEPSGLRDHAEQILHAVANDLRTPQTGEAQREKSLGRAPGPTDATETAAQTHALLRARAGLSTSSRRNIARVNSGEKPTLDSGVDQECGRLL